MAITITRAEYQLMLSVTDPDRQSKLFELEMVTLTALAHKLIGAVETKEIKVKGY